jgi:ATP-dependent DNA helicase RecG
MNLSFLEKALVLESKRGFKNDSVIGGLDSFILKNIDLLDINNGRKEKLKKLFENYGASSPEERERVVQSAVQLLSAESTVSEVSTGTEAKQVSMSELFIPVQYVKGVGPKLSTVLKKLNIFTAYDLIYYFPRDYIDLRNLALIGTVRSGEQATIRVKILNISERRARLKILTAVCTDGTGYIKAVWFNQPYLKNVLKEGEILILHGKVRFAFGSWEMPSPEYEIIQEGKETIHTMRIIPIYSLTQRISQKVLRSKIKTAIDIYDSSLIDYLDESVRSRVSLVPLSSAITNIHFPEDFSLLGKAKDRLIFDELFELQFLLGIRKKEIKDHQGIRLVISDKDVADFKKLLSFQLTNDQLSAISEIRKDFESGKPMNRLLHGDVGSGKTIIALFSAFIAFKNGYQTAMMSPTEILAQQTYKVAEKFLKKSKINVALLTSGLKGKKRKELLEGLREGKINFLIGTHALIQKDVEFNNLGMVIVDEQHRFGVMQRSDLREKGTIPHTLVMSATPIPRTLALTLYGDLDITEIREMPKGRKPITTKVFVEDDRDAYEILINELKEGRKGYVVCPLIEESEELELQSVQKRELELKATYLKNFNVGILHGGLSSDEKKRVMDEFRKGDLNAIISTTVVEVGVDVPDATVIVIEDADRFGLATLHQLRGRVGRSDLQSYCLLLTRNPTEDSIRRLRVLEKTNNGFEVSEEDLKIRGPGEILGTKQHGLPEFKITTLLRKKDLELLEIARKEANDLLDGKTVWDKDKLNELNKILKNKFDEKSILIEVA